MTDKQILDYMSENPECVKFLSGKHGKFAWAWKIGEDKYAEGFSLRSAVVAHAKMKELIEDSLKSIPNMLTK